MPRPPSTPWDGPSRSTARKLALLREKVCDACGHAYAAHFTTIGCAGASDDQHPCRCYKFARRPGDKL